MSRKKTKTTEKRNYYGVNPDISLFYELKFGNKIIEPGDTLKFKDVRGSFRFIQLAHNAKKDVTWIDCYNPATGEYRSFYVDRLNGLAPEKKGVRKKTNV